VLSIVGDSNKTTKVAISFGTFLYFEIGLPIRTNAKVVYRSTGAALNADFRWARQNHDLQTLHAKTPFLSICVERFGGFEQGSQNGDFV
jgi:hypothetical protein